MPSTSPPPSFSSSLDTRAQLPSETLETSEKARSSPAATSSLNTVPSENAQEAESVLSSKSHIPTTLPKTSHTIHSSKQERPPILTLSEKAVVRIKELLAARAKPAKGVRIQLKTKGCSGMAYALSYVDEANPQDELIKDQGIQLYIDPAAVLFLIGTEMDFNTDPLQPGFVFNNPNEKGRCGCGQSFHV